MTYLDISGAETRPIYFFVHIVQKILKFSLTF